MRRIYLLEGIKKPGLKSQRIILYAVDKKEAIAIAFPQGGTVTVEMYLGISIDRCVSGVVVESVDCGSVLRVY